MESYIIKEIADDEFIIAEQSGLILKVIPPHRQNYEIAYNPYRVVAAVFEDNRPDLERKQFDTLKEFEDALLVRVNDNGDGPSFDFEGINELFKDEDLRSSNKQTWIDAINYYCQVKLDKPVVGLMPHNYNYDINY